MTPLLQYLQNFTFSHDADACRVFHGRGQCYPGVEHINVDWYAPVLLVTLYRQLDEPDSIQLQQTLQSLPKVVSTIVIQQRFIRGAPVHMIRGQLPEKWVARERGLSFSLSLGDKQNIGFFLDMAPGRDWMRRHCEGRHVLNLFAYTGAFSVVAMAAGARSVLNVDMSKAALGVARNNHHLNGHQQGLRRDIQMLPYNIFKSWNKITSSGPFDVVVIDPPSRQKGSFVAESDYGRVLRKLPQLLSPGADILACLNAPHLDAEFLQQQFMQHCPPATFVARLPGRDDFPERDSSRSLKVLHYRWNPEDSALS